MNNELMDHAESRTDFHVCDAWLATQDDAERHLFDRYFPVCQEGDLLVELIGYDRGSSSWVQNWGEYRP